MKKIIYSKDIFGMPNLALKRTNLPNGIDIWFDHMGIKRHVAHSYTPRVKLRTADSEASITIESNPKVKKIIYAFER